MNKTTENAMMTAVLLWVASYALLDAKCIGEIIFIVAVTILAIFFGWMKHE